MLEKALEGNNRYWAWIFFLLGVITIGGLFYVHQFHYGLGSTGMSRDVSWGIYIAQFTFMVGVAAGGVMLALPLYIHDYKVFGKIAILGEFMAIAAVAMCLMFITVDLGQPMRIMNVLLHPTPHSMLFWDMIVLNGYLFLNVVCGWGILHSVYKEVPPPKWAKPLVILSVPWAFSIHTVTAFLYCGLPGRHFWLTAILAPRFLASAFAAGPALLIIIALIMKHMGCFDPGKEAIQKLTTIIIYAAITNLFFVGLEFFTAYYSNVPEHMATLNYLFWGVDGHNSLVYLMRFGMFIGIAGIIMLLFQKFRQSDGWLGFCLALIFASLWIDKGVGFVLAGFVPNPFDRITEYYPTLSEISIALGVWAAGALILTLLYKIALKVEFKED
ncbi:MAG: polysulfide reductase NrfD [Deltaproteobacteria bacterium]|nr:polysulfide reductase NrfD [Deltaproteobacteria bacterium]